MTDNLFDVDDFSDINDRFLLKAEQDGPPAADPSGWQHTVWHSSAELPDLTLARDSLHRYQSDTNRGLSPFKNRILPTLSLWDAFDYDYDEVTLCSSVTIASLLTLAFLKRAGIETIVFETPTYYATIEQAKALDLRPVLIPSYLREDFDFRHATPILERGLVNTAVWLCQPRTALGQDQDHLKIAQLLENLPARSYIVLDEATEQHWPSRLARFTPSDRRVIRLRSLFKPIGVNGLRVAYIGHHRVLRRQLLELVEMIQGGLDYESLHIASSILERPTRFEHLLAAARNQVYNLYRVLQVAISGSNLVLSRIDNGYIGSLALPRPPNLNRIAFRQIFLDYCVRQNCPVILGASTYFARDDDFEYVRINYYNDYARVLAGVDVISRFFMPQ